MFGKHQYAVLIITIYTLIGLCVHSDYGISWDEEFQHDYGKVVYAYVFDDNAALLEHRSRYHGPIVQLILYSAEEALGLTDPKAKFELRHLLTFLISVFGCWFFYRLLLLFKFPPYWSLVGLLLMICSPRIFAHSFYNSKDAVFMHLFIIGIYSMMFFLRNPSTTRALLHGLVCGLLIDVRILGVFVLITTVILWVANFRGREQTVGSALRSIIVLTFSTCISVFAFWPTLWHAPIPEFINALTKMSAYPWDDPILFEGAFQLPADLPWYYLLKWMVISTPLFTITMVAFGSFMWASNYRLTLSEKLIPILWFVFPLGSILLKDATVYDGWRHVFFLYPALLILAVHGTERLFGNWLRFKHAKYFPLVFLAFPTTFMVRNHPFQQVYFNPLFSNDAWRNYEMDYWGLSYKQAFEELIAMEPEGELLLTVPNAPGFYNHLILPKEQRDRFRYVSSDSAHFFVSNFRFPVEHEAFVGQVGSYSSPIRIIEVNGNPVVGVFDLRRN